jgi:hypothetical protein
LSVPATLDLSRHVFLQLVAALVVRRAAVGGDAAPRASVLAAARPRDALRAWLCERIEPATVAGEPGAVGPTARLNTLLAVMTLVTTSPATPLRRVFARAAWRGGREYGPIGEAVDVRTRAQQPETV